MDQETPSAPSLAYLARRGNLTRSVVAYRDNEIHFGGIRLAKDIPTFGFQ